MYLVISFVNIPAVIFFTRSFSQNKRQECEKILSFTLFLGIILIIFFTLFLYASTNSIIKLLGNGITGKGNPALAHLTRKMARALFYCTILLFTPLFIFELFSNMMIAEGRNITVLLINLFDFCCQPLFFFIFIKYIDLGTTYSIMVIPLADISVFCFSLIPLFYVVFRDPESFIRIRWRWLRFYRAISFDYFKIGFSVLLRILAIFMIR